AASLHVLPHLWFRNTWSWDADAPRPLLRADGPDRVQVDHPTYGGLTWQVDVDPQGTAPELLFCENDTNLGRLYAADATPPYPKDGINDHVVAGAASVNPAHSGTKCAAWYRLTVGPGETQVVRVR